MIVRFIQFQAKVTCKLFTANSFSELWEFWRSDQWGFKTFETCPFSLAPNWGSPSSKLEGKTWALAKFADHV
ncbi:MAG: hypothetical protein AUK43_04225 [Oscillatoriales cyanobacterium CG2_30_40_61]|nr:MAG: hypothetical protein AUK43_04225 [Oscillatoriales cyanobacterium CG2_30_40_61]